MIVYNGNGLGDFEILTRIHGSAAYKAFPLAVISTGVLFGYAFIDFAGQQVFLEKWNERVVELPYPIEVFIVFFSFLLTFRLSFAYGRYWEAATALYQMSSKWLDASICMCAFHYQSAQFDDIKPPSFGSLPHGVSADRIRGRERNFAGASQQETEMKFSFRRSSNRNSIRSRLMLRGSKQLDSENQFQPKSINSGYQSGTPQSKNDLSSTIPIPTRFQDQFLRAGEGDPSYNEDETAEDRRKRWRVKQSKACHNLKRSHRAKLPRPSLFLQETAHLISLLSAVAMSTLRSDIDQAVSPITAYVPGMAWPPVDPDYLAKDVQKQYGEPTMLLRWFYFCTGTNRSPRRRTMYNAARPFGVLGGVSDAECDMLQKARGPYAKVALCTMWLQEFLSRECLDGSTGTVGSPIISRIYQFISDGVVGYNLARKVAYIPFPFPHGQMTAFFSMTVIFIFPLLFTSFVTNLWFAGVLNFLTVLCFLGLNEVSRELENPFQNVPNDLPLTTFQAQFNEALVTMYAGYAPDSWWELIPEHVPTDSDDE